MTTIANTVFPKTSHMKTITFLHILIIHPTIGGTISENVSLTYDKQNRTIADDQRHVSCVNQNFFAMPTWLESVEILDLSGNSLPRLENHDFPASMSNVKILVLEQTQLKAINNATFANLNRLTDLDLSKNLLNSISLDIFCANALLCRLNLSMNSIKKLQPNQCALPKLETLDVSSCFLEIIDDDAFSYLPALRWLNLKNNNLKMWSFEIRVHASAVLLTNNPWFCDCSFLAMSKKYADDADDSNANLKCTDTERNEKMWNETNISDVDCDEYVQKENNSTTAKKEKYKPSREENATNLILNVYGYVFVGLSILICLCCCCDTPRVTSCQKEIEFGLKL